MKTVRYEGDDVDVALAAAGDSIAALYDAVKHSPGDAGGFGP